MVSTAETFGEALLRVPGNVLPRIGESSVSEAVVGIIDDRGLFKLIGRAVFLALRYNPQALQIVDPVGDLRHRGVFEVPQLLSNLCERICWAV